MLHPKTLVAALAAAGLLAACGGGTDTTDGAAAAAATDTSLAAQHARGGRGAPPACPAPAEALVGITDVQGTGETSPLEGQRVSVRGVVTADFRSGSAAGSLGGLFIQQLPERRGHGHHDDGGHGDPRDSDSDSDEEDDDATPFKARATAGADAAHRRTPAGSQALFVFTTSTTTLAVGDLVQVTGTVTEFRRNGSGDPLTQIAGDPVLETCGAVAPIEPVTVKLPLPTLADFERYEGMLVRFRQPLAVSGNGTLGRFGELVLAARTRLWHPNNHPFLSPEAARDFNARAQIVLDDARSVSNPSPIPYLSAADSSGTRRPGDRVRDLTGVLTTDFGAWRLQPTVAPTFEARNLRPAAPAPVGGSLKAASLNVLNHFTTLGSRGASTAAELERQRAKLVATIVGLDADVLGLIEIQNDGRTTLQGLVDAVNAQLGAPVYAFRSPGIAGDDEITTAVVYKAARVRPVGNPQVPTDPGFAAGGGLRPPVAQRFQAADGGGGFWFVVNHLKSKGSCPASAADPDADLGQGCWNPTRVRQAQALAAWVQQLVAGSGEPDVLMAGDFNAYFNEDPIRTLRDAGHEPLLGRLPPRQRYSYVFDNEAGALDHAFASRTLGPQVTGVAVWHTNADEPVAFDYNTEFKTDDRYAPTPYRASDHDPVVVGLALVADTPAAAAMLAADLPAAGRATEAVAIENLAATPTAGATNVSLVVDWGDGSPPQALAPSATRAEHVYAAAGRYTVTLTLSQDGSLPAKLTGLVSVAPAPVVVQPGLFISEYVEGSSFNKAVELYNPGTVAADLSRYTLRLYANGSPTPTASLVLDGSLAPGATHVICHPSIVATALPACQRTNGSVINFNGDDALTLERDGVVVDQFGQVGFDPGSAWTAGGLATVDRTLRRKAGVAQGSVPPAAPAAWDLALEWDGLPNNTLDGLGSR